MPRITKKRRIALEAQITNQSELTIHPRTSELKAFLRQLESLAEEEKFCDVTLRIQHHTFKAHRIVLAASNSFLGVMMMTGLRESSLPVVDISPDTDPKLFRMILDYIYGKSINVPETSIFGLLALANCYSMPQLRDNLAEHLISTLNLSNCCRLFAFADAHNCSKLREQTLDLIYQHFSMISLSETFTDLNDEQVKLILASDNIVDCPEIAVFEAACRWLSFQALQRTASSSTSSNSDQISEFQALISSIMSLIRYPLIDSFTLSSVVKPHEFMTGIEEKGLLLDAFEYHALKVSSQTVTVGTSRTRKVSCPFTTPTLIEGHKDSVSAMVCFADYFITGSWDSTIKVWDQSRKSSKSSSDSGSSIPTVTSSKQLSDMASSSRPQSPSPEHLSRFSKVDWHCIKTLEGHAGAIRSLCICNDKIISCSDDGIINIWDRSWTLERAMDAHDGAANAVIEIKSLCLHDTIVSNQDINAHASMHRLVSAGDDGEIKVWNTNTWTCEITLNNAYEAVDGNQEDGVPLRVGVLSLEVWKSYLFSGGDDNVVRVWSTLSWTCVFVLRAHEDEVWALRVLPNGILITGSVDATIRVWNVRYRKAEVNHLSVSEDNEEANESSDEAIYVPKIVSWECVQVISSDGPVYSLSFLDNRLISAGASKRISVWHLVPNSATSSSNNHANTASNGQGLNDGMTWQILKYFDTVDEGVWSLTVHKNHLISGGCEGTILYWN